MDYKLDVRETMRHWTVRDPGSPPLDARLELKPGDELVFLGDGTPGRSTIRRRRKLAAEVLWGENVTFTPSVTDPNAGQATGDHKASAGEFTIDFFSRGHSGRVDFGKSTLDSGSWMADEGP